MTATDELRRMLDERGVEHDDSHVRTWWDGRDCKYCYYDDDGIMRPSLTVIGATPVQAIDATLGRGECHNANDVMKSGEFCFKCSECGWTVEHLAPRFCPGCGRKVVDA